MTPWARRSGLAVLLVGVIVLLWLDRQDDRAPSRPATVKALAETGSRAASGATLPWRIERLMPRVPLEVHDQSWALFGLGSAPGAPAVGVDKPTRQDAAVSPPPAPPAPLSLPYVLLGRLDESGRSVVFLQEGERALVVGVGDKIGMDFTVESIAGSRMVVRHLPTGKRLALDVGGAG